MTEQRGFTLIELMVSLVVASVVMLAMGNMLITGMRLNQTSEHRLDAAAIAQSVLSNISARSTTAGYAQATAQAAAVAQLVNKPWFIPTITLNPTPTVAGRAVAVTVQLDWNERTIVKSVTLTTLAVVN